MMNLFKKKEIKITPSTSIGLTDTGRREAEQYSSRGAKFTILAALSERAPMPFHELAEETEIDKRDLKGWITKLVKEGYIRIMGGEY